MSKKCRVLLLDIHKLKEIFLLFSVNGFLKKLWVWFVPQHCKQTQEGGNTIDRRSKNKADH